MVTHMLLLEGKGEEFVSIQNSFGLVDWHGKVTYALRRENKVALAVYDRAAPEGVLRTEIEGDLSGLELSEELFGMIREEQGSVHVTYCLVQEQPATDTGYSVWKQANLVDSPDARQSAELFAVCLNSCSIVPPIDKGICAFWYQLQFESLLRRLIARKFGVTYASGRIVIRSGTVSNVIEFGSSGTGLTEWRVVN